MDTSPRSKLALLASLRLGRRVLVAGAVGLAVSWSVCHSARADAPPSESFLVIVMGLLVWWIFADSEDALMIIATVFVVSGVSLHVVRVVRQYLVAHSAKT